MSVYGQQIWDGLMVEINNEFGVAGLMGNLQAESGLIPYRLQGDFSNNYTTSIAYTSNVDNNIVSEYDFVNNGPNGGGYGLAQWTYYTRKQALYNMKQSINVSIGSVDLAINFLITELVNSYSAVLVTLKNAISIREASDTVLHDFENPADQSELVELYRASLGSDIYSQYTGGIPINPHYPKASKGKAYLYIKRRRFILK